GIQCVRLSGAGQVAFARNAHPTARLAAAPWSWVDVVSADRALTVTGLTGPPPVRPAVIANSLAGLLTWLLGAASIAFAEGQAWWLALVVVTACLAAGEWRFTASIPLRHTFVYAALAIVLGYVAWGVFGAGDSPERLGAVLLVIPFFWAYCWTLIW